MERNLNIFGNMEKTWNKGNCMGGCKHACTRSIMKKEEVKDDRGNVIIVINEFDHYEYYCDLGSPNYKAWHDRNANNTYEVYKKDLLECYEPDKFAEHTGRMIDLMNEILEKVDKTKES